MNVTRTPDPATELRAASRVPFAYALAMPPSVYHTQAFLDRELSEIFAREWYCMGRADALANSGDYATHDLAGQPIVVLRDGDGALRAMSNVCRHRMSTLLAGRGNVRAITCPYHAWTQTSTAPCAARPR